LTPWPSSRNVKGEEVLGDTSLGSLQDRHCRLQRELSVDGAALWRLV
ncbi:MAG: hypothetical protein HY532_03970, partial [Chloroflexi bacterium]|nr:hypothetical protein [Chloroflexota bacterium]